LADYLVDGGLSTTSATRSAASPPPGGRVLSGGETWKTSKDLDYEARATGLRAPRDRRGRQTGPRRSVRGDLHGRVRPAADIQLGQFCFLANTRIPKQGCNFLASTARIQRPDQRRGERSRLGAFRRIVSEVVRIRVSSLRSWLVGRTFQGVAYDDTDGAGDEPS
jgi:hypothetical protein